MKTYFVWPMFANTSLISSKIDVDLNVSPRRNLSCLILMMRAAALPKPTNTEVEMKDEIAPVKDERLHEYRMHEKINK